MSIPAIDPAGAFARSASTQGSPFQGAPGTSPRPLGPAEPTSPIRPEQPGADRIPPRRADDFDRGPVRFTAYQRNADGDDAALSSRADLLTDEERAQVEKLQARDREVRTHEEAHRAAAGALFRGGPSYSYQTGPDGRKYAVGGSVQIDTSPGRTPEETVQKARRIRQAALAPAEPSSTDRAVAARAAQMEAEAQAELATQRAEQTRPDREASPPGPAAPSREDAPARENAAPAGVIETPGRAAEAKGAGIEPAEPPASSSSASSAVTRLAERGIDLIA